MISPPTHLSVDGTAWSAITLCWGVYNLINDAAHDVSTLITQEPDQGPEDWDVTLKQELGDCLAVWLGSHMPLSTLWNDPGTTRTLVTLGSLFSPRVISMLVKSTCKRSIRVVATIRCRGALDKLPSCCKQCAQDLMDCCIWLVVPSHQKCSHSKDKVESWHWWLAFLWHPFKVVTQWTLGTTKSRRSLVSPLGIECKFNIPDELWNSANSIRSASLLCWRCVLPEVPSNLSSSVPSASPILCSTLGPLSGLQPNQ